MFREFHNLSQNFINVIQRSSFIQARDEDVVTVLNYRAVIS